MRSSNRAWAFKLLTTALMSAAAAGRACAQDVPIVFFGETQLRYEGAENDVSPQRADGVTQAIRAGLETNLTKGLSFLAEGEFVYAIVDDFNDGTGNNPTRPVIPNPDTFELNRIQLQATLSENAFVTIGRQIIALDDQRFIGPARFRQNNQTFDGVHFSYRAGDRATIQAGYFNQVNRILGGDNVNGRFEGDSYFINTSIRTPVGRLGAFHYALDLETGPAGARNNRFSSKTTGVRLEGRHHRDVVGLDWVASYARQSDFADNPNDYSADYWLAGATGYFGALQAGFQYESLGAGEGDAFQTPGGTRRKFQGLADLFLVTPADGVDDYNVSAGLNFLELGAFSGVSALIRHHWFRAERGGSNYGTEIDLIVKAKFEGIDWSFGFAHYSANNFATDTDRVFVNITKRF